MDAFIEIHEYSWGTLRKIEVGKDFSVIIHPDTAEDLRNLASGSAHRFQDETGTRWTAKRNNGDLEFTSTQGRRVTVAARRLDL